MKKNKRIRAYGIEIGNGKTGPFNKITDVKGVKVGHYTVDCEEHKTGVTVIMPCEDNMFKRKLTAAAYVHNGFGKSQGLVQIEELGTIETPIALTNTLNIGRVHDAIVEYMVKLCEKDQTKILSVNPIVGECNDSQLNRITERVIGIPEVMQAIDRAVCDFEEGDVGAGKGTVCFGCKGGIGSASRIITIDQKEYTIGVLVQSNFGKTSSFILNGQHIGAELEEKIRQKGEASKECDQGSIMMIIATDLPVIDRQLKRIIKRAGVGLSRCGSYMGHGSGDIMIGFTTANRIEMNQEKVTDLKMIPERFLETAFCAVADATEEAVLNSLSMADTVKGFDGNIKYSLTELYLSEML